MKMCGKGARGRGNRECKDPRWRRVWSVREPERRLLGLEGRERKTGGSWLQGKGTGEGNGLTLRAAPGERACRRENRGREVSLESPTGVPGNLRDAETMGVTEGRDDLGHEL